jgi:hypothetical protein
MISSELKPKARIKWQAIIEAQESSGVDVVEYCNTNGICRSSFYGRRKQLRHALNKKRGFLKLLPSGEADMFISASSHETPVNIRTPNGYQIGLRLPDENGLGKILGILKSL